MRILTIGVAVLFSIFIIMVIYNANTGGSMAAMQLVRSVSHGDKVAHFCLFGLLSLFLNIAFAFKCVVPGRNFAYVGTVLVLCIAVVEEFSQLYIPRRMFDPKDLLADVLGVLFFTIITACLHAWIQRACQPR